MRIGVFSTLRELTFAIVKDCFFLLERKARLTGILTCIPRSCSLIKKAALSIKTACSRNVLVSETTYPGGKNTLTSITLYNYFTSDCSAK